jgi:hypothetical protein
MLGKLQFKNSFQIRFVSGHGFQPCRQGLLFIGFSRCVQLCNSERSPLIIIPKRSEGSVFCDQCFMSPEGVIYQPTP